VPDNSIRQLLLQPAWRGWPADPPYRQAGVEQQYAAFSPLDETAARYGKGAGGGGGVPRSPGTISLEDIAQGEQVRGAPG
jgi:hypothetical protein